MIFNRIVLLVLYIYTIIYRYIFPYKTWIKLREKSIDEYGEKLCYCGHTYRCSCANPDKKLFKESVKCGSIILWDKKKRLEKWNMIYCIFMLVFVYYEH